MATTNQQIEKMDDALTYIRTRKAALRTELVECSETIRITAKQMFAPPKASNKMESFFNILDQGMAVYDGVILGMRVMRNFKRLFGRRR